MHTEDGDFFSINYLHSGAILRNYGSTRRQQGNAATPDYALPLSSVASFEEQDRALSCFKNDKIEILKPDDNSMTGSYIKYKLHAHAGRHATLAPKISVRG